MGIEGILRDVKNKIRPSLQEHRKISRLAKRVVSKIKIPKASVVLGGSFAKDTWMKNTKDIDIYVRFDYKRYKDDGGKISDLLEKELRKSFKPFRLHGSRDYFQIEIDDYKFEIVPIIAIKKGEEALNITDFSSYHVDYVRKHKRLADDVRLAKAFTKACGTYGAESYIRGFSGYVLELLVIKYGSFLKLVKNAAKWKPKVIIGDKRKSERLSWAKKVSPLILIDPVQPDRNAAAALSDEKFFDFVNACKNFLKKPSEDFFIKKKVDVNDLRTKGSVVMVTYKPLKGKEDVVGAKALKAFEYIRRKICDGDFLLKDSHFEFGTENRFNLVVDRKPLSDYVEVVGPPVKMKEHAEEVMKKHPNSEIDEGRLVAHEKRTYREVKELMYDLVNDSEVKTRVKSLSHEVLE